MAERLDTMSSIKLGRFWFQLETSYMSSHTEELWYSETVCLWMTISIYLSIYIYIYIHHQVVLLAQIPFTSSYHPSLFSIALGIQFYIELINVSFCGSDNIGMSIFSIALGIQFYIELINVSFCGSDNIGMSICGCWQENFAYEFVPISPAVFCMSCLS